MRPTTRGLLNIASAAIVVRAIRRDCGSYAASECRTAAERPIFEKSQLPHARAWLSQHSKSQPLELFPPFWGSTGLELSWPKFKLEAPPCIFFPSIYAGNSPSIYTTVARTRTPGPGSLADASPAAPVRKSGPLISRPPAPRPPSALPTAPAIPLPPRSSAFRKHTFRAQNPNILISVQRPPLLSSPSPPKPTYPPNANAPDRPTDTRPSSGPYRSPEAPAGRAHAIRNTAHRA
ncbi:hypothetical protein B0H17DRAFT_168322 [Mycena rosella]|uniref:Uncharacterized protein n=1 Tax=Mycena rosella TaxID=1033263 RepID=A0AAD7GQQ4_MYCRO|nr:hypothetical protein B0H17DRAFT_168322 [Mycena rosella]